MKTIVGCVFLFPKPGKFKTSMARVPYNKLLTNFSKLEPYWGILALGRFCTDLALLGLYCHDLGPIFPSTALALGL